jgi:YidC/Oxa1 family membrane protein insertase
MDRNSAIGLTLIAALLLAYFYWFAPQPQAPSTEKTAQTQQVEKPSGFAPESAQPDSLTIASYGDLSAYASGNETPLTIETEDLNVSSKK